MQKMGVFMGVSDHQFFLINKKNKKKLPDSTSGFSRSPTI
jgi:hypothetical protein